jgi:hypothetical protein
MFLKNALQMRNSPPLVANEGGMVNIKTFVLLYTQETVGFYEFFTTV